MDELRLELEDMGLQKEEREEGVREVVCLESGEEPIRTREE